MLCLFFFFQAEDGIRDLTVTGVQTCALPIYPTPRPRTNGPAEPVLCIAQCWRTFRTSASTRSTPVVLPWSWIRPAGIFQQWPVLLPMISSPTRLHPKRTRPTPESQRAIYGVLRRDSMVLLAQVGSAHTGVGQHLRRIPGHRDNAGLHHVTAVGNCQGPAGVL